MLRLFSTLKEAEDKLDDVFVTVTHQLTLKEKM